jgi:arylformamidase
MSKCTQFPRLLVVAAFAFIAAAQVFVAPALAAPPAAAQKKSREQPPETAVLSEKTVVRADVAYGSDAKQRLDVYSPRGTTGAPIVVFFHRGEWSKYDKSGVSYKPKFCNENGIIFASANYRLSPAATHPAHIRDVAAVVRWVYDHAAEIGGSPKKIVVMGHSCGCHLVTLLALDPRWLAGVKLRPADLAGVVAWSGGAYDLVAKVKEGGSYAPYVRQAFGDSESVWRDASPMAHVGDAKPLPRFLFVSFQKGNASTQAAEKLAGMIKEKGGRADLRTLEDRTHFTANHLIGAPEDKTGTILLDFVRDVTR